MAPIGNFTFVDSAVDDGWWWQHLYQGCFERRPRTTVRRSHRGDRGISVSRLPSRLHSDPTYVVPSTAPHSRSLSSHSHSLSLPLLLGGVRSRSLSVRLVSSRPSVLSPSARRHQQSSGVSICSRDVVCLCARTSSQFPCVYECVYVFICARVSVWYGRAFVCVCVSVGIGHRTEAKNLITQYKIIPSHTKYTRRNRNTTVFLLVSLLVRRKCCWALDRPIVLCTM